MDIGHNATYLSSVFLLHLKGLVPQQLRPDFLEVHPVKQLINNLINNKGWPLSYLIF
jgi:hypothetical protein